MSKFWIVLVLIVAMVVIAGCAAGPNEMQGTGDDEGKVVGFWRGLWHGIISPITFIISLFSRNVHFYEVHNNGNWYNLGWVVGAGMLGGGGLFGCKKKNRRDD